MKLDMVVPEPNLTLVMANPLLQAHSVADQVEDASTLTRLLAS